MTTTPPGCQAVGNLAAPTNMAGIRDALLWREPRSCSLCAASTST